MSRMRSLVAATLLVAVAAFVPATADAAPTDKSGVIVKMENWHWLP
ncbi:MAG TPA: hypothetical protein VE503_03505 [Ornithinibacter sp.]|jgi:hypothetical protein|nr:hypothetical protein [Ornithinibacter sp.]